MQTQAIELETRISNKDIQNIAVLGQGIMGVDIALTFALSGYKVTAVDVSEQQLETADLRTKASLKLMMESGLVEKNQAQKAQQLIVRTIDWDNALADADFVMEVVPENIAQKKAVFEQCDKLCSPDVIIASNTSSMSITHIAEGMDYPQRAITAHWTIPAHLSPLVEVVRVFKQLKPRN